MDEIKEYFKGKTFLVTGGLGSIGKSIVAELLKFSPAQIRVLDNRETELFYARKKYEKIENIRFFHGDVREKERLIRAMQGVDIVYHAAALKHVLLSEYDPYEAIKTNVLGTQNVVEAAIVNDVEKVIFISTDKAVNPCSVMGSTKLLAERLVSSMAYHRGRAKTKFGAVRFGNVLSSRGSVLEIWSRQLKNGERIHLTDPDMTRFFMTIAESVKLIFYATLLAEEGETFIFKMKSVRMKDLAELFLELNGKQHDHYDVIGKSSGEKMHEKLFFEEENAYIIENRDFFVRLPIVEQGEQYYGRFKENGFKKRESTDVLSSKDENTLLSKEQMRTTFSSILKRSNDD